jgi:hypothetical protein
LLYWKQAWLKPVSGQAKKIAVSITEMTSASEAKQFAEKATSETSGAEAHDQQNGPIAAVNRCATQSPGLSAHREVAPGGGCSESDVWAHTQLAGANGGEPTYLCQVTAVPDATSDLNWWDLRQYLEDYRSGNVGLGRILSGLIYSMYYHLAQAGIGVGPAMRWFYDKFVPLLGGTLFPRKPGVIPEGQPTPSGTLNLQPGEVVRVRSHQEILQTVNVVNANRGMYWDAELVPYCGGTYRVLKRVTRLIDEKTGKMMEMKNPCIILDSVVCQARYSSCRMLCPKSMYPYWREIWLERVGVDNGSASGMGAMKPELMSSAQH